MSGEVEAILHVQRADEERLRRMVGWLCTQLAAISEEYQFKHCPPGSQISLLCEEGENGCAACWLFACKRIMKEKPCQQ